MGKDIRIKPSSSIISFTGSVPSQVGSIELDSLGRLNITASEVLIGANTNEVYIGDGTSPSSIVFDFNGSIVAKSGSGAVVTVGSNFTPLQISASSLNMSASTINITQFTASAARISNAIITGSISSSASTFSNLTASRALINTLVVPQLSASTITLATSSQILFTGSSGNVGASMQMDAQGNLVLNSISGSVFLAKDTKNIYIGDGINSADVVFDVAGAIRGQSGSNILVTLGSADTRVRITGSTVTANVLTASSAIIQGGQITASAIQATAITGNTLQTSTSVSSSLIRGFSGSYNYITASTLQINANSGGIYLTSSDATKGGSITLDAQGNLVLGTVTGSVIFGSGSNNIYVGDGVSSAYFIFDYTGGIKSTPGTSLLIGSSSANLEVTASTVSLQKGGGNVGIGTASPSYTLEVSGTLRAAQSVIFSSTASIAGPLVVSGAIRVTGSTTVPPGTAPYATPTNGYGANTLTILGDPSAWLQVQVDGLNYKIPLYN